MSESLATDPEVWVRFPALPDFLSSGAGKGQLSLVSITKELLERKSSGSSLENREYGCKDVTLTMWKPLTAKIGTTFAEKRWSLDQYRSLADSGHGENI
jgi:hypothetical protein